MMTIANFLSETGRNPKYNEEANVDAPQAPRECITSEDKAFSVNQYNAQYV
jgi:hypothetical protein